MDARAWIGDRPDLALLGAMLSRLAMEPRSVYRAKMLGGEKWFGWSPIDSELLALLVELTHAQISATAQRPVKVKELIPRPSTGAGRTVEVKASSVRDLNWGAAMNSVFG